MLYWLLAALRAPNMVFHSFIVARIFLIDVRNSDGSRSIGVQVHMNATESNIPKVIKMPEIHVPFVRVQIMIFQHETPKRFGIYLNSK